MDAMDYATSRRRSETAPTLAADASGPDWSVPIHASAATAAALEAVVGLRLDEAAATSLLDATAATLDVEEEAVGASWADELGPASGASAVAPRAPSAASPVPAPTPPRAASPTTRRPGGDLGKVFDTHTRSMPKMKVTLSSTQRHELSVFRTNWEKHRGRYDAVAAKTGVPAILIAAIHYRESSLNWNTYLHQGDPLGRPARNHPKNIPVFHDWESAAIHALGMKRGIRDALGMTAETTDPVAMATFAEAYNGLGYHYRGLTSPYVYAGSDQYRGGRFVADGKFDRSSWDRRLGVSTIASEMGEVGPQRRPSASGTSGWRAVLSGDVALRQGSRGEAVRALQERLATHGHAVSADGSFGPATRDAVVAFQRGAGLTADGVVGAGTAAALDAGASAPAARSPEQAAWEQVTAGREVLSVGSRGPAVEALQERLRALGYGVRVDGSFGPATRGAVLDAQRALRVGVDGSVGPATAAALDRRLGR
jgi:peptidoglycan hydrolase-like protein with peptidoglycan-binding domain/lysozyme family protein